MLLCVKMLNEKRRGAVAPMEICKCDAWDIPVEWKIWGGRKQWSKNHRLGKSNWVKDYISKAHVSPTYLAQKLLRRFGIPRTLCKRLKRDLINHRVKYWETRMIAGRRLGKPTDVKIVNCLNLLSSGNSAARTDYVAYMAEDTGRK